MSRDVISLTIDDLSQFCKTLRSDLPQGPSHAQMLGLVAKAAGYRNYQHLRAQCTQGAGRPQTGGARAALF